MTSTSPHGNISRRNLAFRSVALLIVWLAFALRLWHLDTQSLWHDEGLSWWFARAPLLDTLRGVAGTEHPPLYFLALGLWMRAAGESAFALRFLSVVGGVLAVAVLLGLARRWGWRTAGLMAALFLAWNPTHIWYSQEVRSYAWTSVLGIGLTDWAYVWYTQRRPRDGVIYGVIGALALYVHTFIAFLLAVHGLLMFAIVGWRERRLRPLIRVLWPYSLVALTFLPWMWPTLSQLRTNRTYFYWGYLDVSHVIQQTAQALAFFNLPPDLRPVYVPRLSFFLWGLAAIGSLYLWSRRQGKWIVVSVWGPLIITLSLAYFVPKYAPRYVLYTLPMWYLLAVMPVIALARWTEHLESRVIPCMVGAFLAFLIAGYGLASWHVRELTDHPRVARPDFRGAVGFIQQKAQRGDAVILVGGHMEPITRYYLRREDVTIYPLPRGVLLDLGHPLRWGEVAPVFNELTRNHPRVWTVFWQEDLADPQRLVYSLAQTYWCPVLPVGLSEAVDVGLYLVVDPLNLPLDPIPQHRLGIPFRNGLELLGFDAARILTPHTSVDVCFQVRRQQDGVRVAAGETLYVVLYFRVQTPQSRDLTGFVHLVSRDGSKAYALADRLLGDYAYPPQRWQVGEVIRQEFPVRIPPETRPGEYALEIGLYYPGSLQRVDPLPKHVDGARVDGSRILYMPVRVLPP